MCNSVIIIQFHSVGLHEVDSVHHSGKPETRHQLVEAIGEDTVGLKKRNGTNAVATYNGTTGRIHAVCGHSKIYFNNTETYFLCLK
jgi:hypothetical protein